MPLLSAAYVGRSLSKRQLHKFADYLDQDRQFRLWNYDAGELIAGLREAQRMDVGELIDGIYASYARSRGKEMWGDKTPSFFRKLTILNDFFPHAIFVHIVRDGRDVFDSWRRVDPVRNDPFMVALDWKYKVRRIESVLARVERARRITIRYEDLVETPRDIARSLCDKLEVEFEDSMLEFYKSSRQHIGDHHSKLIFGPIDATNRERWRDTLSAREVRIFEWTASASLDEFGYPLVGDRLGLADLSTIGRSLAFSLPRRAGQIVTTAAARAYAMRTGTRLRAPIRTGNPPADR